MIEHDQAVFTYFITSPDCHVKIGRSKNPLRRLKIMQTSCPQKLSLAAKIPTDRELEFHDRFSGDRVHGEWFLAMPVLEWLAHHEPYSFQCWRQFDWDDDEPAASWRSPGRA